MIELLALPGWDAPPRTLDDWAAQLAAQGAPARIVREAAGATWLEVAALRLRGFAVIEGPHVSAINFELAAPDPGPATQAIETAARALGWEVHPDEPDDEGDDDD